ncbi:MAG: 2-phospho-L-lactate guanylyltransferase [Micromonosporaceae bacterium]
MAEWSVVIPVKRLSAAKSRLRGALPGVSHDDLVLALALDTAKAALDCPLVRGVTVVTDDPAAQAACGALGVEPVPDLPDAGLNPALEHGARQALLRHPRAWLAALGGDLPALRPQELADALTAAEANPRSYVADAELTGTVLLAARPDTPLSPSFGVGSADLHRLSGAAALEGEWPSLRRDVDTAADLAAAARLGLGSRTRQCLRAGAESRR